MHSIMRSALLNLNIRTLKLRRFHRLCFLQAPTVLKRKIPNVHWYNQQTQITSKDELIDYFCNNIIYEDDHLIAFNKPFNMTVALADSYIPVSNTHALPHHIWNSITKHDIKFGDVMNEVRKQLCPASCTNWHLINLRERPKRLETGVLLVPKHEECKQMLGDYYRHKRFECATNFMCYSVLTNGILNDAEGEEIRLSHCRSLINDMTLSEMLEPDKMSKTQRRDVDKKVFSMKWKTVNSNSELGCSHVELWTNTGSYNVVELFCAHQLCPILGDHVYSHLMQTVMGHKILLKKLQEDKIGTPQHLDKQLLKSLEITAPNHDTTVLPLHLHLQQVNVPSLDKWRKRISRHKTTDIVSPKQRTRAFNSLKSREILTINAPLPEYYTGTMKRLQL